MALSRIFPAIALAGVLASAQASLAAEGGFSFYLPGSAGDIALAQSSEPGLQVANSVYFLSGDAGAAVLQGKVNAGLGPGFIWFPEFAEGKLAVLAKWIHDFDATNRFESDYGTLTVAWTF